MKKPAIFILGSLVFLAGCSASRTALKEKAQESGQTLSVERSDQFPGMETLASWPRVGEGPIEILWDETEVRLDSKHRQSLRLRRVYRVWDGAKAMQTERSLVFASGTRKATGRVQTYGPDGLSQGTATEISSDLDARGRSLIQLGQPGKICSGCLLDTRVEAENERKQPALSAFVNLPSAGPIHRAVIRVSVPEKPMLSR